jgi:hypothetical protein
MTGFQIDWWCVSECVCVCVCVLVAVVVVDYSDHQNFCSNLSGPMGAADYDNLSKKATQMVFPNTLMFHE